MQINATLSVILFFAWFRSAGAQEINFNKQEIEVNSSFRGISVPDDQVAWVSGTGGVVLKTLDAGKSWIKLTVSDNDSLDFRSIYALDDQNAFVALHRVTKSDSAKTIP